VAGARTYVTAGAGAFTERHYVGVSELTGEFGQYANAGTAGSKTVGLSAPAGQRYSLIAVEILGGTSAAPETGRRLLMAGA
jgi:hypothetical protein